MLVLGERTVSHLLGSMYGIFTRIYPRNQLNVDPRGINKIIWMVWFNDIVLPFSISQTLPIALVAQICEEPTKPTPTKTVEKKIFIKAHASKIINAHLDKLLVKLGLNQ